MSRHLYAQKEQKHATVFKSDKEGVRQGARHFDSNILF